MQTKPITNEVKNTMPQNRLPFKYAEEKKNSGLTAFAGLPLYFELFNSLNIFDIFANHLDKNIHRNTIWRNSDSAMSLLLLNLAGGNHVDDIRILQNDAVINNFFKIFTKSTRTRSEYKKFKDSSKSMNLASLPAPNRIFRFLNQDSDENLEGRGQGKAFIPNACKTVQSLSICNSNIISAFTSNMKNNKIFHSITLDMDATLIETHKDDALYSYKGYAAYQPLNIWWNDMHVMLHTEFRDGNVPAGYALQPALEQAIQSLPIKTQKIFLRSDTAAYDIKFLKHCEKNKIKFAIGCPITPSFRNAVKQLPTSAWKPLGKSREYAEVCFVPESLCETKKMVNEFRYIVTREIIDRQQTLSETMPEKSYPFPTERLQGVVYKLHAIVTNRVLSADRLIQWYYKRSGYSEEVHAVIKNDLAGGILPSGNFNANAIWWWLAIIAHNIHSMFKRLCLSKDLWKSRLKKIRFSIINIAGRVVERGRQLYILLSPGHPAADLFATIREAISRLRPCPQ